MLLDNLKPGMTLAREVWGAASFLPLLRSQNILTQTNIDYLKHRNVAGAYVEFIGTDDIDPPKELFTTEEKVRLTAEVQTITKQFYSEKGNIFSAIKAFNKIADYVSVTIVENADCMLNLVEIKNYNDYAYTHSMQVGILSAIIGKRMGFGDERIKSLTLAGILHDIGKLKIDSEILNKESRLTEDEFLVMKKHPEFGFQKLSSCSSLSASILDGVSCHHEKYDGSGYPYGISKDAIPLFARIIAIADVYDALTSPRSYRPGWEPHEAINYMMARSSKQFDTAVLTTFLSAVAAYPIGVLVELSNGDIGVVIKTCPGFPLSPVVKVLSPTEKYGKIIDLANDMDALTLQVKSTVKDAAKIAEAFGNGNTH